MRAIDLSTLFARRSVRWCYQLSSKREIQSDNRPVSIPRLHQNRFVAPSEKMSPEAVTRIETPGRDTPKPTHPRCKISLRGFHKEMVVIAHEDKGMTPANSIRTC